TQEDNWNPMTYNHSTVFARLFLVQSLVMFSVDTHASAPYEHEPVAAEVRYGNGDKLRVTCQSSECEIIAKAGRRTHKVRVVDSELGVRLFPRGLVMFSGNSSVGTLSIEMEMECSEIADELPRHYCVGNIEIDGSKVIEVI